MPFMATTTTTHVFDDIDGTTDDVRTVTFSVDGAHYEIDLSSENHAKLTEALAVFVGHARKASSPTAGKRGKAARSTSSGTSEGLPRRTYAPGPRRTVTPCLTVAVSPPRSTRPTPTPTEGAHEAGQHLRDVAVEELGLGHRLRDTTHPPACLTRTQPANASCTVVSKTLTGQRPLLTQRTCAKAVRR